MKRLGFGVVSPQDWGLPVAPPAARAPEEPIPEVGLAPAELEARAWSSVKSWLPGQYDEGHGAFHGHYSAPERRLEVFNTVNLVGPWQLLAAFDRSGDRAYLDMALRAADWFHANYAVSHPMSVCVGGIRDTGRRHELWTKYAAEHAILNAALARRTAEERLLDRAKQSASFLRQSRRHLFAPRYDENRGEWLHRGWQSFGRCVEANLELERATGERAWLDEALAWGEHGLGLQHADGGYYLLDGEYYNSDIAADELRALCFLHELTGRADFLHAAAAFGRWHLEQRRPNGFWPVNLDTDGHAVAEIAGPGDMSNLAISFLRLSVCDAGSREQWLGAARSALGYGFSRQAVEGSGQPYLDDPRVLWGFWSWDPYYDYTLSADQSTHHVRAAFFLLDLMAAGHADR